MNFLILSSFCLFVLIPITHEINCISCTGWSNSGCNDPYNEATSGDLPVPGNTYCLKVVYPTYVERMAGGRACTSGSGVGSSVRYCCSDKDYCNRALSRTASMISIILLIMACLAVLMSYHALTDELQFVKNIAQFYIQASSKEYVLSDVSSFHVLIATAIRRSIAPLPYADVGPNVIRAIASYSDKQMSLVRNDQFIFDYGLTKTKHSTSISSSGYLSLNNRRFSLVDVSEH
ncbi:unnamed protein product [Rotaria sordida]|uniref:Uncharacterized protein n=1 Tax=Rotaria sordida TaxID=392033 RepID=A0A813V3W5_9BILA|nr:unnamed protein product [Rotaria sordida]CAF0857344.1 unnamed protein product [Rotaria sordida]